MTRRIIGMLQWLVSGLLARVDDVVRKIRSATVILDTGPGFVGCQSFPHSVQHDGYSCGVHSTRAVLRHFDFAVGYARLQAELRTDENGTYDAPVIKALRRRSLRVRSVRQMSTAQLKRHLADGAVAIVDVDDSEHFAVVHGMSSKWVYIADSSPWRCLTARHSVKAFRKRWSGDALIVRA